MTESIADIAVQHQKNRGTFHHNRMYIIAAAASTSQKKSQRFSTNISFLLMIFTHPRRYHILSACRHTTFRRGMQLCSPL